MHQNKVNWITQEMILWIGLKIFDAATDLSETISIHRTDPFQNDDSTLAAKRPALLRWHSIIQFISPIPNPWESWKWHITKFVSFFAVHFEYFLTPQYSGQWKMLPAATEEIREAVCSSHSISPKSLLWRESEKEMGPISILLKQ